MEPGPLSIGELARRTGVRASALRYYEQLGLLPLAARIGGRRVFPSEVLRRLAVVKAAQDSGLSLAEIGVLLAAGEGRAGETLRALAVRKLPEVEATIARAQASRRWLKAAEACDCPTIDACALLTGRELIGC